MNNLSDTVTKCKRMVGGGTGMLLDSEAKFSLLGISVHFLYLFSVFHIYFKSPILEGLPLVAVPYKVPAKRMVLIITDGLQAEKAFHHKYAARTSFFRSVLMHNGSWGVSHTRVPTETRVGHVSIAAGTYEDVSAITNGWKNNPVAFDSIINQSSKTWYWGEKGVINIFNHHSENINSNSYVEYDFAGKDTSKLDRWVFEKVEHFLTEAKQSETLKEQLNEGKTLFFLHLIGIDTVGHAMKPDSMESLDNVAVVNEGIENITKTFDWFFDHDGLTTYIVTSDHGMTPWGTHGAGLPSETETPFVAWGAGIKGPMYKRNVNKDLQSAVWGLEDYERRDIEQIDLAPLMAYLIGSSIPANSLGQLPVDVLDVSDNEKAMGMLLNVKQIREQYKAHEQNVINSAFTFQSFSQNEDFQDEKRMLKIKQLIESKDFSRAINDCKEYISVARKGISYYQNYNRLYLCLVVNIGFLMWMLLVVIKVLKCHTTILSTTQVSRFVSSKNFSLLYYSVIVIIGIFLWHCAKSSVLTFFSLFPLVMLKFLINELNVVKLKHSFRVGNMFPYTLQLLFVIFGIEMIVLSFFKRGTLSVVGIFLGMSPWIKSLSATNSRLSTKQMGVYIVWTVCMLLICIFPQFPVVAREENYFSVMLAGFLATTVGLIYSFLMKNPNSNIIAVLTGFLFVTVVVKMHTVVSINNGNGLPFVNQVYSWSSLLVLPAIAFFVDARSIVRLFAMCMSMFAVYLLTAISYEAIFLLNLILLLTAWILMEFLLSDLERNHSSSVDDDRLLTVDDIHRSFIFLFFIFLSFFGTGNIASINSFDIPTTYCFQTIFNKTIQGIIIAFKVFIPFGIVTLFFRSLQSLIRIPIRGLFLSVLLMTDLMALNFFFLIKDEGSWLDIGQSVSHFIITLVFIVVLVPIYELSYYVSGKVSLSEEKSHVH